jgi:RNA 3'-terminal phosphate cyclase (ATP)
MTRARADILTIDGSQGEGGGQVLRTSLALSIVSRRPVRITSIRAERSKPGLMRQHLAAVKAAAEISAAHVEGAELGSRVLVFEPGDVRPREFTFAIGTAGSTMLVLQTVLPPLMVASGPSRVIIEGGTHNGMAPPFDFIDRAFLPLIRRIGPSVTARLERYGFYPAGGGRVVFDVTPAPLARLDVTSRGETRSVSGVAFHANLARHIADREVAKVQERLGWPTECLRGIEIRDARGPGNAVVLTLESENVTEVFSSIGAVGVSAEEVADRAASEVRDYLRVGAPIGPYLADQLLIPMALAGGGTFRTGRLTPHAATNIAVISRFIDTPIREGTTGESVLVRIGA